MNCHSRHSGSIQNHAKAPHVLFGIEHEKLFEQVNCYWIAHRSLLQNVWVGSKPSLVSQPPAQQKEFKQNDC